MDYEVSIDLNAYFGTFVGDVHDDMNGGYRQCVCIPIEENSLDRTERLKSGGRKEEHYYLRMIAYDVDSNEDCENWKLLRTHRLIRKRDKKLFEQQRLHGMSAKYDVGNMFAWNSESIAYTIGQRDRKEIGTTEYMIQCFLQWNGEPHDDEYHWENGFVVIDSKRKK